MRNRRIVSCENRISWTQENLEICLDMPLRNLPNTENVCVAKKKSDESSSTMSIEHVLRSILTVDGYRGGGRGTTSLLPTSTRVEGEAERVLRAAHSVGGEVDLDCADGLGTNPLQVACAYGHTRVALCLLRHGANISVMDNGFMVNVVLAQFQRAIWME